MSIEKVVQCVKKHKKFLITSHINLEGDAIGSELAFYELLKKLGKEATIINESPLPYRYEFLPHCSKIKKFKKNLRNFQFDCFVVLDSSDLGRIGKVLKINTSHRPILNIDHHISNKGFGNVNWIELNSSSCCEMVYKLYKKLRLSIDRDSAICLYAGMLTDTGSFRYSNTTGFTHRAIGELLKHELEVAKIYKSVYENIPFKDIKLLTQVLPNMKRAALGKIAWFQIRQGMLGNKKVSFDLTETLLSFARAIKDVEVVVLFRENLVSNDEIRVNLRSQGKIDVNEIARFFGGGGHKTASGATVRGKIAQVRRKVLTKIKQSLA